MTPPDGQQQEPACLRMPRQFACRLPAWIDELLDELLDEEWLDEEWLDLPTVVRGKVKPLLMTQP